MGANCGEQCPHVEICKNMGLELTKLSDSCPGAAPDSDDPAARIECHTANRPLHNLLTRITVELPETD